MKLIRLTSGTDVLDLTGDPNFDGSKMTKGPGGTEIPRFRFVSLRGRGRPADLRGWPHEVTDQEFDDLMTTPSVLFEEVTPEQATEDRRRAMGTGGSEVGRLIFGAEAYLPPPPVEIAASLPRAAAEIKAEVEREIKVSESQDAMAAAAEAGATPTPKGKGK